MRKVHFTEIDPFSFGREVAEEIYEAAINGICPTFGPYWDRVWRSNNLGEITDQDIESGEYIRWEEEAESAMRVCLDEQS